MTPHEAEQVRRLAFGIRSDLAMVTRLLDAATMETVGALGDAVDGLTEAAEALESLAGRTLGTPHPSSRSSQ